MIENKSITDLYAMFVGYALSGYAREGVSYASREDECREVAIACCDLAEACIAEILSRKKSV